MNISCFSEGENVHTNYECVKGFAFANAPAREKCAVLPVICAGFAHIRDNCTRFQPFECLLPASALAV